MFSKRFIACWLAIQVLLMSTGFAVTEHFCKIRGEKTYSFVGTSSCCKEKVNSVAKAPQPTIKRASCCKNQVIYAKVTPQTVLHKSVMPAQEQTVALPFSLLSYFVPKSLVSSSHYAFPADSFLETLLRTGRTILLVVQCFRI